MNGDMLALEEAADRRQQKRLQIRQRASRLLAEGLSCREIMERLSISRSRYYQLVAELQDSGS